MVTVMGMVACSDDHYDVVVPAETAGKTLWQNIQENEQLSEFASVLSATSYLKSDMDYPTASAKMSYADYLNSPQSLTIWAPVNGSFNVQEKLAQLEAIKNKYAEDPKVATKEEYVFASQFLGQHIARFNHESQGDDKRVRMINAKYVVYDAANKTFDGIDLVAGFESLPSSNGTLHLLNAPSVYAYNIFDYLSSSSELEGLNSVFTDKEFDVTSFSPGLSTEGAMNSDGKMEYVDSVYSNINTLLNMANAQLKNEDSVYVAVFPTNEALEEALENVKSLFNYKKDKPYYNLESEQSGKWTASDVLTPQYNYDSLQTLNAKKLLFSSLFFSPSIMGETVSTADPASIINYCLYNDSVKTTNSKIIYNKNKLTTGVEGAKNPFFLGADEKDVEPVKVSNGYIFVVDRFNLDLAYSFIERRETGVSILGVPTNGAISDLALGTDFKNDSIIDPYDVKSCKRIEATTTGRDMKFQVSLPALKSGRYNVYAILLPSAINVDLDESMDYTEQLSFDVKIFDPATTTSPLVSKSDVSAPSDRVQKVLLVENWNLEYSYDGLPQGTNSYPYLQFEMLASHQIDMYTGAPKCFAMNLYKIVIEPYREDSTNE